MRGLTEAKPTEKLIKKIEDFYNYKELFWKLLDDDGKNLVIDTLRTTLKDDANEIDFVRTPDDYTSGKPLTGELQISIKNGKNEKRTIELQDAPEIAEYYFVSEYRKIVEKMTKEWRGKSSEEKKKIRNEFREVDLLGTSTNDKILVECRARTTKKLSGRQP